MEITEITKCRICGNEKLITLMDLGEQPLSGIFPKVNDADPPSSPLKLVKCDNSTDSHACGLVQLKHSCDPGEMFRNNYGYLSGMNKTMTDHLSSLVEHIESTIKLHRDDVVIDIGSNDGTLLKSYKTANLIRVGIDPGGEQYKQYYPKDIAIIPDFFPSKQYKGDKAKVITSIAMFYDLEDPMSFVKSIKENLHEDGMWVFEQSYLPTMLEQNSFDTICHEHLEYYALAQVSWMLARNGLKLINVETNHTNGGSFRVYAAHENSTIPVKRDNILNMERFEGNLKLNTNKPYIDFYVRVQRIKDNLMKLLRDEKAEGKTIYVYGASTKGNILLNYFGVHNRLVTAAADRNPQKWVCKTPGTQIPIVSEEMARKAKPDYMLVLPWHFKKEFIEREHEYLTHGGRFIFPLPLVEVVGGHEDGKRT